jgi:hypothetical protein
MLEGGMEITDATFKISKKFSGVAFSHVQGEQFAPILEMDKSTAENYTMGLKNAAPKIGKIGRVEGLA